jgi:hypothetical protein
LIQFSLEYTDGEPSTREQIAIHDLCRSFNEFSFFYKKYAAPNTIAVGSVDYCLKILPKQAEIINFYPKFLRNYFGRTIRLGSKNSIPIGKFIKSATTFKGFTPRIVTETTSLPDDQYWISDEVSFKNEWRYYVSEGQVITTGWYSGEDEDKPAPAIQVDWPKNFCGAVDFGEVDGRMLLVEAHSPFACGWYGQDNIDYAYWLIRSWKTSKWI